MRLEFLSSEGTARFSDGNPTRGGTILDGGTSQWEPRRFSRKGTARRGDDRRIRRSSRERESRQKRGGQRSLCLLVPSGRREPQLMGCERLWRRQLRWSSLRFDLGVRHGSRKTSLPSGGVVPRMVPLESGRARKTILPTGRVVPPTAGEQCSPAGKTILPYDRVVPSLLPLKRGISFHPCALMRGLVTEERTKGR